MHIPFFDLSRHNKSISLEMEEAFQAIISSSQFILGEQVRRFEQAFSSYLNVGHCITCGNGTDALELALSVCGVGAGDEVIVPAFGWISPALAVKRVEATPVFVDVCYATGNMDVKQVEQAISKKTKAIIPIHLFGLPCDILALRALSDAHSLYLIEDCAQAHGAAVDGTRVGGFGDLAVFSFYPTKNLGCLGDGGAVMTNREDLAEKLFAMRDYGRVSRKEFKYFGRNSRLDEMQAAFLNVKLKYLDEWNSRRRGIAKRYWTALDFKEEDFPQDSVFHQFTLKVRERNTFQEQMRKKGVYTDTNYPLPSEDIFQLSFTEFGNALLLSEEIVSLPIYQDLLETEISYICDQLSLLKDYIFDDQVKRKV